MGREEKTIFGGFKKMKKIILILSFILFSCTAQKKKTDEITTLDIPQFFNIVYEVVGVRVIGSQSDFIQTSGSMLVKFETTTVINIDSNIPDNLEGRFTFNYSLFSNPIDSFSTATDGGYSGRYLIIDTTTTQNTDLIDNNSTYSVFDPYGTDNPIDPDQVVENLLTFNFSMTIPNDPSISGEENKNCFPTANCTPIPSSYDLSVIRFPNGTLIMEEPFSGFQYYLKPKLI